MDRLTHREEDGTPGVWVYADPDNPADYWTYINYENLFLTREAAEEALKEREENQ